MENCGNCGKNTQYGDKFCRGCGSGLPEHDLIECECGSKVFIEDNFCHNCGAEFEGMEEVEADEGEEEETEEPESPPKEPEASRSGDEDYTL